LSVEIKDINLPDDSKELSVNKQKQKEKKEQRLSMQKENLSHQKNSVKQQQNSQLFLEHYI
jgi:hypothetical protein